MSMMQEIPPTAGMILLDQDFYCNDTDFEKNLALFLCSDKIQVRLLSSGTAACIIALLALKSLKPDRDEVILPAFTCPLVAIACAQAGLKIKLCDLVPDSFEMDSDYLKNILSEKTLCVVPTHLGGLPHRMDEVIELSHKHGAYVLEDAAQALGAKINDKPVGLHGDIGFYSLTAGKGLTIYEGGFLATTNLEIAKEIDTTIEKNEIYNPLIELKKSVSLFGYKLFYNPFGLSLVYGAPLRKKLEQGDIIGALDEYFSLKIPIVKVSDFRKSVGNAALSRLETFVCDNQTRAKKRIEALGSIPFLKVVASDVRSSGVFPYVLLLFERKTICTQALDRLWSKGLGVSKAFAHELSAYPYLKEIVPQDPDGSNYPNAKSFAERNMTISNSHFLQVKEFDQIIDVLKEITQVS